MGEIMNLTKLISFFRKSGDFDDFCKVNDLNPESEVIEIFSRDLKNINSDLGFFQLKLPKGEL